jgi:rhomboid protease GluP
MFRWILDDTRALIADLRAWGRHLSSRWHWFRLRSRRRMDAAAADYENVRRGADVRTRMCGSCRALIPVEARKCPECGAAPGRAPTRGTARILEHMMPSVVSISSIILTVNLAAYGLQLLVWQRLVEGGLPPSLRDPAWIITLHAMGANVPVLVEAGEWWRLITMMFLHGGLVHLLFNSWALLAVGPLVEEVYGSRKMLVLYVFGGLGGSLASYGWRMSSAVPAIGASGAIFALIGVAAVWGYRRGGTLGAGVRAQMMQWALYGLMMGFLFRADNAAHVGGFVTGALLAAVVPDGDSAHGTAGRLWEAVAWVCGVAIVGSFVMVSLRYASTIDRIVRVLTESM